MLTKEIFTFLEDLKNNNHRQWFETNKMLYLEVKKQFDHFVEQLLLHMSIFDNDLAYLTVKDCTYRIYRDIRFSADKSPYKTNMGAYMVKGGKKSELAGYYFHVEPGNCMIAGGIWMPSPHILKKLRWGIYENIEELLSIIENPDFKKFFPQFDDDAVLSRPPRDFPSDFPYIHLLKYKSYTVSHMLSDEWVLSPDILQKTIEIFKILQPLNRFFNSLL